MLTLNWKKMFEIQKTNFLRQRLYAINQSHQKYTIKNPWSARHVINVDFDFAVITVQQILYKIKEPIKILSIKRNFILAF